jgi:hypothetical protein
MPVTDRTTQWKILLGLFGAVAFGLALLLPSLARANVDLLYFRAVGGTDVITLEWETASELDNLGFNVYRSTTGNWADATRLNSTPIPSQVGGQPIGAFYDYPDTNVVPNTVYTYWLEDLDFNGNSELHDPVEGSLVSGNTIPTVPPPPAGSTATPTSTRTPTATATATSQAANPTATPTSAPTTQAAAPTSTPPPTATAAANQNQGQPAATQSVATPQASESTAAQTNEGYPVPGVDERDQPAAPETATEELAGNPDAATTGDGAPAVAAASEGQPVQAATLSAAPIGSGSQPQDGQNQQSSGNSATGNGLPRWLVAALMVGLLMAAAGGGITLLVFSRQSKK